VSDPALTSDVKDKLELARLRRVYKSALALAFDPLKPDSRPNPVQQSVLADTESLVFWLLGGNRSGKSQSGARVVSWWFNGDHPHMDRPAEWGDGPLQILVIGRLGEQIESELWERKLKPFMRDSDCQVVRIGGVLKRVIHRKSGNRIIFLSHHDADDAREKAQAFTSHIVWLDEMPDKAGIVTELVMRVISNRGRLYGTFTPLIRNEEIRKIVDTPTPVTRKVQLSMLDNPIYRGREREVEAMVRAACASEAEFRARMYGEWYYGDGRVFAYDAQRNRRSLPERYAATRWRHLAVLDPAASGTAGLTVWAEDPEDGAWYNVLAKYLKGAAAFELLDEVERHLTPFSHLTRRCDCNPSGFYKEAARRGVPWLAYTDKNDRKLETIERANTAFATRRVWLTDASAALEDELVTAVWSERDPNKIVNSSAKHLADTLRYAIDLLPPWAGPHTAEPRTGTQALRAAWKSRVTAKAKAAERERNRVVRIHQRRGAWRRHS
jgi:hypothetical protein